MTGESEAELAGDPRFLRGVEYFNECDFFEAHEAWEELWSDYQGPSRKFLQGLIQAAVCLHHFANGNLRGARKLYHSSRSYLEGYRPRHMGVDLDAFLAQMEACCRELLEREDAIRGIELNAELIPEIHLQGLSREG